MSNNSSKSNSNSYKTFANISLEFRPAKGRKTPACWLALPPKICADAVPLIAVHGINRNARDQAEQYAKRALEQGRPVIAPLFDKDNWRHYQQVVRKNRPDVALLALLDELRLAGIWQTRTFELAGYSGGAQFAHRFAMLYPHLISRLSVASAGWYTFPDNMVFPRGLGLRSGRSDGWGPHMEASLDQFLKLPIQVYVGSKDNIRDPNTRSGANIDQHQGTNRLTRATRWVTALKLAAEERNIKENINLKLLLDCRHDFIDCVKKGGLDALVIPDMEISSASEYQSRETKSIPAKTAMGTT